MRRRVAGAGHPAGRPPRGRLGGFTLPGLGLSSLPPAMARAAGTPIAAFALFVALGAAAWWSAGEVRADSRLPLTACHLEDLSEQVLCGSYTVHEDRARRQGRTIDLQIAVLPALRRPARPDPLFILAGGPGQGARRYARVVSRSFRALRRTRDIVLVDLRGMGGSHALECRQADDELARLSDPPVDPRVCLSRLETDADVRLYTTPAAMEDLDEIRRAMGYDRINLWGGSFGTRAALIYARAFPSAVRMAVLDGAAPFELAIPTHMAEDGERALGLLAASCGTEPACAVRYPRLRASIDALLRQLDRAPVTFTLAHPRTGLQSQVRLTRDSVAALLRVLLYSPSHVSLLPFAVSEAIAGRVAPLVTLYAEGMAWSVDTMAVGTTLSILCSEDLPRVDTQRAEAASAATFVGGAEVRTWRQLCAAWPRGASPDVTDAVGPVPVPALVLSGDRDPATPPRWGELMRRYFTTSRHLVVNGAAHNVSFSGCAPELIARAMEDGLQALEEARCVDAIQLPAIVPGVTGPLP